MKSEWQDWRMGFLITPFLASIDGAATENQCLSRVPKESPALVASYVPHIVLAAILRKRSNEPIM